MPQVHPVVLNYDPNNTAFPFGPTPRQVAIKPADVIQFNIGDSTRAAHPGCKLRITLHHGANFSHPILQHLASQTGSEPLTLTALPSLAAVLAALLPTAHHVFTAYKCELLHADGVPIPGLSSDGSDGGEIVRDTLAPSFGRSRAFSYIQGECQFDIVLFAAL